MFRIRWEKRALNELTNIWTQANSIERKAITAASHLIDQRLRNEPNNAGESRSNGRRFFFEAPLTILFRVEADGVTVSVLTDRMYRPRRP